MISQGDLYEGTDIERSLPASTPNSPEYAFSDYVIQSITREPNEGESYLAKRHVLRAVNLCVSRGFNI